jgi:cytochrome b561
MYTRLVVRVKQQKPVAMLPGPMLRLAARVVHACLVRRTSVLRSRKYVGPHSALHLIDCAAEGLL